MKRVLNTVAALVIVVLLLGGGMFMWARSAVAAKLATKVEVHQVDFPIPFPLREAELEELRTQHAAAGQQERPEGQAAPDAAGTRATATDDAVADGEPTGDPLAGLDLAAIALERAVARGKHLVEARYVCIECHGQNFGGGVMIDDAAMGRLLGPNITTGKGGKTSGYKPADWDRIVRHGIKPDGSLAVMPAEDFQLMTDQELSDIVAYLRTAPPVDNEVPPIEIGPLATVLVATGKLPIAAEVINDHVRPHGVSPPAAEPSADFGKHLSGVCTGCHRPTLEGGPIVAGPPDWPPAANLTPHAEGLSGYNFEQFDSLMRTGKRADGTALKAPMSQMMPYANSMTEVEMRALWAYLSGLEPRPTGK